MSVHWPVLGHPIPVPGFGIPDQAGSYRTSRQDRRNRLPSFKNIPPDSGGKDKQPYRRREIRGSTEPDAPSQKKSLTH